MGTIYYDPIVTYYNIDVETDGIELDDNQYINGSGSSMGLDANIYLTA